MWQPCCCNQPPDTSSVQTPNTMCCGCDIAWNAADITVGPPSAPPWNDEYNCNFCSAIIGQTYTLALVFRQQQESYDPRMPQCLFRFGPIYANGPNSCIRCSLAIYLLVWAVSKGPLYVHPFEPPFVTCLLEARILISVGCGSPCIQEPLQEPGHGALAVYYAPFVMPNCITARLELYGANALTSCWPKESQCGVFGWGCWSPNRALPCFVLRDGESTAPAYLDMRRV